VTLATASSLPRAAVPCESGCFFGTATIRGDDIVGAPPKSSLPPKRFSPRLRQKVRPIKRSAGRSVIDRFEGWRTAPASCCMVPAALPAGTQNITQNTSMQNIMRQAVELRLYRGTAYGSVM